MQIVSQNSETSNLVCRSMGEIRHPAAEARERSKEAAKGELLGRMLASVGGAGRRLLSQEAAVAWIAALRNALPDSSLSGLYSQHASRSLIRKPQGRSLSQVGRPAKGGWDNDEAPVQAPGFGSGVDEWVDLGMPDYTPAESQQELEELSEKELAVMVELMALADAVREGTEGALVGYITGASADVNSAQGVYYSETESWSARSSDPFLQVCIMAH